MKRSERGATLALVLVLVILLGGISSAFFVTSLNEHKDTDNARLKMKATYLAELGNEEAAKLVRRGVANNQAIAGTLAGTVTTQVNGHPVDVAFTITNIGNNRTAADSTGLQSTSQQYEIISTVEVRGGRQTITRIVDARSTPVFQFLAFYSGDLEIQPGPAAVFHGRIHTNRDLYAGAGTSMDIISEYVHAVGAMYRHRKDNGAVSAAPVRVSQTGTGALVNWDTALESTSANWATDSQALWSGSVKNNVPVMEVPQVQSFAAGGYYNNAALAGGNLVVEDDKVFHNGVNVTAALNAAQPGTITGGSVYDHREGRFVPVTKIDMAKLRLTPYFPTGGLMYAHRTGATAAAPQGIQLVNGQYLANALTVVSPDPVYVKGDYNTLAAEGIPGKKPAAIIADAVNLLSNSWDGSKNPLSTLPVAADTTFNFAMITGNHTTNDPGYGYNGGFENLPRFHENWSGKSCRIRGSFVCPFTSQIAKSKWQINGNFYVPPNRDWDYDSDFNDPTKLPPFTPVVASIGRTTYQEGLSPNAAGSPEF